MFALRGIAVSLTFFVLLYCFVSAIVAVAWRALKWMHKTERHLASLLFAARILPLVASVAITAVFVIPSFQLLEPRSTSISIDEGLGAKPLALGICALLLIAFGCIRVFTAQTTTSRIVAGWLKDARPFDSHSDDLHALDFHHPDFPDEAQTITFRSPSEAPPLTLVGVCKPKVLVSESTIKLLTPEELHIALKHERAHIQSRDNLKKLIFRFCPFPGMSKLEAAWSQTAELAADDAAVAKLEDAVDLAAALVKLSRIIPAHASPICTVGFVTGSIGSRVARLLAWDEAPKNPTRRFHAPCAIAPICVVVLCMTFTYGPMLQLTHEATEWLVR